MCDHQNLNKVIYFDDFRSFINDIGQRYDQKDCLSVYDRQAQIHTISYQDFSDNVVAFGAYLQSKGYSNKHCAIIAENSVEWLTTAFALAYIGSIAVSIDTEQADETIIEMIKQADCEVVFYSSGFKPLQKHFTESVEFIMIDDKSLFTQMLDQGKNDQDSLELINKKTIDADACSFIYYTSGTTSTSKPVMLSQKAILFNAIDAMALVKVQGRLFTSLPFYHTYGLTCSIIDVLSQGLSICINGNMKTSMRDMIMFEPHYMMAVPLIVETIYKYFALEINKLKKADELEDFMKGKSGIFKGDSANEALFKNVLRKIVGNNLKMIVCGGAHISEQLIRKFDRLGIIILQGYGITECSPLVSVNRDNNNQIGSVGRVLPHYQVKIVDNEIYVKGTSLMLGYYKDQKLTDEAFADGWFKTGDIGHQDKQGFLYITGRKKNLIVFKNGKKTSPEEIEGYLYNIPYVKEVLAYGAAAGVSIDDVKLCVTIYPDPILTQQMASYEILDLLQKEIDKINTKLPAYKQIQMVKISENSLPKTGLNKIKRS
ncbi:MAG: AMP-binding protein [Erysipelotrichaceae bacterium]|nr:AMP-binding protein [Erysipelotrichaceae bacterium]MDD4642068.1 AMP-binding protein [Erysipelotrichaceae bacterium]